MKRSIPNGVSEEAEDMKRSVLDQRHLMGNANGVDLCASGFFRATDGYVSVTLSFDGGRLDSKNISTGCASGDCSVDRQTAVWWPVAEGPENGKGLPADKHSALLVASRYGDEETVRLLLGKGASPNSSTPTEMTALMSASKSGHAQIVKTLLTHGAEVDRRNLQGDTALMLSCHMGHLCVTGMLLAAGASVNVTNGDGLSALLLACDNGGLDLIRLLLASGAETSGRPRFGSDARLALLKSRLGPDCDLDGHQGHSNMTGTTEGLPLTPA